MSQEVNLSDSPLVKCYIIKSRKGSTV